MDEFPSSKAFELETEFDGLMPMMECDGDTGEQPVGDGQFVSDEGSDYSDNEEELENAQISTLSVMKDASEVFGPNVELLWAKKNSKGKAVKLGKTAGCVLPQEISDALSQANFHYANGDHSEAIELLSKVTRLAPHLPDPFHIMALIYDESGDKLRSLQFFALAAVHTPKSADVWIKVCDLAMDLKEYDQAMTALCHAMKREISVRLHVKKILLLILMDQLYSARQALRNFLQRYPAEVPFLADFGHACQIAGYTTVAIHSYLKLAFHIMGSKNVCMINFSGKCYPPSVAFLFIYAIYSMYSYFFYILYPFQFIKCRENSSIDIALYRIDYCTKLNLMKCFNIVTCDKM